MSTSIQYNANRHSGRERTDPRSAHPRYVHLRLLAKGVQRVIAEHLQNKPGQIMADMGCGEVPYRQWVEPHLQELVLVDIPGNPQATHTVDLTTNLSTVADGYCDVVWSVMVLEHVANVEEYLAECYRIMKPGGKLLLCTHGHWMYHPDPIDRWRYTHEGLRVTLERAGFTYQKHFGIMGLLPMSLQLMQDAALLSFPGVKVWKRPFCWLMQRWIDLAEWYTNRSNTLRAYTDKDACLFFFTMEKPLEG